MIVVCEKNATFRTKEKAEHCHVCTMCENEKKEKSGEFSDPPGPI